ncbi:hypothetical protein E4U24_000808 [Claviceps purpurea]|nr:hypothetical protein E4U24_000808 [Claviceps purpurea]
MSVVFTTSLIPLALTLITRFDESAEVILEGIDAACAFRHEDSGTFGIYWALVGDPWHTTTAVTYYWHYIYQLSTCSLPFALSK